MLFPRCKKTSLFDRRPNKSLIIMFLLENATQKKSHLAPIVSQNVQGGLEYSGQFPPCLQNTAPHPNSLLFTPGDNSARYVTQAITWLSTSCHSVLPNGPQYQKWHRTICRPSYFSPSCRGKVLKINHANIMRYPSCGCWWVSPCISSLVNEEKR